MSSFAGYCNYCGKPVMHKTFFGTLHLCITPEERAVQLLMEQKRRANTSSLRKLAKTNPIIAKAYQSSTNKRKG